MSKARRSAERVCTNSDNAHVSKLLFVVYFPNVFSMGHDVVTYLVHMIVMEFSEVSHVRDSDELLEAGALEVGRQGIVSCRLKMMARVCTCTIDHSIGSLRKVFKEERSKWS